MTHRQSATVLVLLAVLYAAGLILLAPQLDLLGRQGTAQTAFGSPVATLVEEQLFDWLTAATVGTIAASPAFLAIWAVHGRQRASHRLPLTAWLLAMLYLAAVYGEARYFGGADADQVLFAGIAWLTAYVAILLLLALLRAVRGWRLQRGEFATVPKAALDSSQPNGAVRQPQFTIRTLLAWTAAAGSLCAGLRWLAPYGAFYTDELPANLIEGVLIEGAVLGLIFALAALPVLSTAWIVLADGRRATLRCVLAIITIVGIAGGTAAFRWWWDDEELDIFALALAIEAGALAAGVAAASVVRGCGYRLVRPNHRPKTPAAGAAENLSFRKRQFARALAPLAIASVALLCYAPRRIEVWRRADEVHRWAALGWYASLDAEGHVDSLMSNTPNRDLAGTEFLLDQSPHLKSLQFENAPLSDVLLSQFPPLAELEHLDLSGTTISDAGLSYLTRFPNLESLDLSSTKVTDAGLAQLRGLSKLTWLGLAETGVLLGEVPMLPKLEGLDLEGTAVGDAGLSQLERFPNLQRLDLVRTNVTDAGVSRLGVLKSLTRLDLRVTEVTDDAVAALSQLIRLQEIDLQMTAVSEAGFEDLHKLLPKTSIFIGANDAMLDQALFTEVVNPTGARRVGIAKVPRSVTRLHARGNYPIAHREGHTVVAKTKTVTDAGLTLLVRQTAIEELDLRESGVTDAGLASLAALANLKRLDLRGTQVTEDGCAQLAKTLPNCTILR